MIIVKLIHMVTFYLLFLYSTIFVHHSKLDQY